MDLNELRGDMALVDQVSYLYPESIAENIAYGTGGDANTPRVKTRVEEAALAACADGFIREIPGGYEATVAEKGGSLSGGQRQRISIARSLMKKASLICLDEATSATDGRTEEQILGNLLATPGLTCMFVAHRLAAYRSMDRIIVMDQGRIVEEGSFHDLMRKRGVYHRMLRDADLAPRSEDTDHAGG